MITINGLSGDYYYVNNPIYLEFIPTDNYFIQIFIEDNKMAEIEILEGKESYLEISNYIKPFLGIPDYNNVDEGMRKLNIEVRKRKNKDSPTYTREFFTKYFLRGGYFTGINNTTSDGEILKESNSVPLWEGYPQFFSKINGNTISRDFFIPENYREDMRVRTCNPIYFLFLNSKGAFEGFLFDSYKIEFKSGKSEDAGHKPDVSGQFLDFNSIGGDVSCDITASVRVDKRHYRMMRALAISPIVYVFQIDKIIDNNPNIPNMPWTKIKNNGNNFEIESGEDVQDITFNFEANFTEQTNFKW